MKGKKTGGRQKGTPNKTTSAAHPQLARTVSNYLQSEQFQEDFAALEPKDRLLVMEKYASYVLPKLQATTFEQFQEDFAALEPKDRLLVMEKYASYVLPKLQATTFDIGKETQHTIEDKLRTLAGEAE